MASFCVRRDAGRRKTACVARFSFFTAKVASDGSGPGGDRMAESDCRSSHRNRRRSEDVRKARYVFYAVAQGSYHTLQAWPLYAAFNRHLMGEKLPLYPTFTVSLYRPKTGDSHTQEVLYPIRITSHQAGVKTIHKNIYPAGKTITKIIVKSRKINHFFSGNFWCIYLVFSDR